MGSLQVLLLARWSPKLGPISNYQTVSKLDFSHFQKERVGYARHRSVERGELYACPTCRNDTGFDPFRATVLGASFRACPSAGRWRGPHPWQTDGEFGLARDGSRQAEDLPSLPSSVEPCCLVEPESESGPFGFACGSLCG